MLQKMSCLTISGIFTLRGIVIGWLSLGLLFLSDSNLDLQIKSSIGKDKNFFAALFYLGGSIRDRSRFPL